MTTFIMADILDTRFFPNINIEESIMQERLACYYFSFRKGSKYKRSIKTKKNQGKNIREKTGNTGIGIWKRYGIRGYTNE